MKKTIIIVAMLLITSTLAFSTTYYVRTTGSDNNTGLNNDDQHAWKTMTQSFKKIKAGDTLYFADGTYNEVDPITNFKGGSKTKRTTIKSINKWGAKIICNSTYQAIRLHSDGVIFDGFDVTWASNPSSAHNGVEFQGNWITIRNCNIHHIPFGGIQGAYCDNVLIENNYCHDNYSNMGTENGSGISIWDPTGIEPSGDTYNIIIRNNICYNNWATTSVGSVGKPTDGNGIILDDFVNGQNPEGEVYPYKTLVENNLCYNNGGRGIHAFYSNNITIRNNTCFYNNWVLKDFFDTGEIEIGGGTDCEVYNNISVTNYALSTRPVAFKLWSDENTTKIKNNLLCGKPFSVWDSNNGLTSGTNSGNVTNSSVTYPAFVNPQTSTTADFHLKSSSPAINTGYNSNYAATDLDGIIRPQDNKVDMGCYEYLLNTGINELLLEPSDLKPKITIFPNPVMGNSLTISLNEYSKAKDTSLAIIDLTGKVFYETVLASQQKEISIPRSYLPKAGLYLVRVTNNKMIFNFKLIIV